MNSYIIREQFEAWAKDYILRNPHEWPLLDGHDNEEHWAEIAWQANAELNDEVIVQKDKEILGLQKQVNAYKMLNDSILKTIEDHVHEGVAFNMKELTNELKQLNSERETNQLLTNEIAYLQSQIDALMLEYCPNEMTTQQLDNWVQHQRPTDKET